MLAYRKSLCYNLQGSTWKKRIFREKSHVLTYRPWRIRQDHSHGSFAFWEWSDKTPRTHIYLGPPREFFYRHRSSPSLLPCEVLAGCGRPRILSLRTSMEMTSAMELSLEQIRKEAVDLVRLTLIYFGLICSMCFIFDKNRFSSVLYFDLTNAGEHLYGGSVCLP